MIRFWGAGRGGIFADSEFTFIPPTLTRGVTVAQVKDLAYAIGDGNADPHKVMMAWAAKNLE